ncbi:hypothetical protein EAG_04980 [Camponotus floridanus]|uniref:Uncharacterized protein n=2 Tax=Camponotus floridanus TaxID=104421 RepID=E2AMH3_CAMFO|nr:hypothetical protein EAG_04980 [Camponotus floridanus]
MNENKGRSIADVVITVSPVYVPSRTPKLKKGEAVDYPITPKYSTLDNDMIAKLDATVSKKLIQHRFHPPAIFEHNVAYANRKPSKGNSNAESSLNTNSSTFLGPIFPNMYEYSPTKFLDDESLMSEPMISKYPSTDDKKIPDSYKSPPNKYNTEHETDYLTYGVAPSYANDELESKPMKFANYYEHPPSFMEHDPYAHDVHHDIIYDNIPEYHHHETTTEEPEMNDQRLDKRPYSYYFIGKKLWYIPLYFSIYFIIYIAALVLKSVARHKINFPVQLAEAATQGRSDSNEGWWSFTEKILEGVERFAEI